MVKGYRMSLVISFVLKLKGDGKIDEDGLWSCLSFIIITVQDDFLIVLYIIFLCFV